MAEQKLINTRIALKIDTLENWSNDKLGDGKGAKLVLKRGEIGLCEIPSGNAAATTAPTVLFKVGDGKSTFADLKWASALAADVYSWAKAKEVGYGKDAQGNETEIIEFRDANGELVHSINLSKFALDSDLETTNADVTALKGYFNGGVAKDAEKLGGVEANKYAKLTDVAAASHTHENWDVLVGITSDKVTAWDNAEENAKDYVDEKVVTINGALDDLGAKDLELEGKIETLEAVGATKVEASGTNGNIKISGNEVKVYDETALSNRIKAIEDDYLKATDKDDLQDSIDATQEYAEGVAADLSEEVGNRETAINNLRTEVKGYADEAAAKVAGQVTTLSGTVSTLSQTVSSNKSELEGKISEETSARTEAIEDVVATIEEVKSAYATADTALSDRIDAIDVSLGGLTGAMHFIGVFAAAPTVNGNKALANGDVYIDTNTKKEYVYSNGAWVELGDEGSYLTKTEASDTYLPKATYNTHLEEQASTDEEQNTAINARLTKDEFNTEKQKLETAINGKVVNDATYQAMVAQVETNKTNIGTKVSTTDFDNYKKTQTSANEGFSSKITALEEDSATHATKTEVEGLANVYRTEAQVKAIVEGYTYETVANVTSKIEEVNEAISAEAKRAADAEEGILSKVTAIENAFAKDSDLDDLTTRVATAEGKITTAEGKITTAEGKITTLEGKVSSLEAFDHSVYALKTALTEEAEERASGDNALSDRIDAYDERFGTKEDILVFDCGTSTTNI